MAVKYPAFRKKFPLLVTGSLLALQPLAVQYSSAAEQYDCQASATGGWACTPKSATAALPARPVPRGAVAESTQEGTERQPVSAQEDVDGDAAIAFPPPYLGLIHELSFQDRILDGTKIIDRGHDIVAILYHTNILVAGIGAKCYERVAFGYFSEDFRAHKYR